MLGNRLSRRHFLRLLASAGAFATAPAICAGATRRPNIILILADDIGVDGFSCYGSASYQTPRLDEIAASGIRFTHCYSQPLCTPSRVQIMTGRGNFRNYTGFGSLSPRERTFAHMLQDNGYDTCVVGKWQLAGRSSFSRGVHPLDAGFDDYCAWQIFDRGSRYLDPLIAQKGRPLKKMVGRYGPDVFTDYLIDFISKERDQPFLAYYPMALVHSPFVPTPDSSAWNDKRNVQDRRFIVDMVRYMDKIVGRIADKLDELGLADNTLLMFTSDNGTNINFSSQMRDGRVIRGGKGLPTDAGTHVPLIARWRGVTPAGGECDDLISFDDFMPTMAAASGAALPSDREIDGRSFFPQLRGERGDPREWIICYYEAPNRHGRESTLYARNKRYKLYHTGEFYDVREDPLELSAIEPAHRSQAEREAAMSLERALATVPPPVSWAQWLKNMFFAQ